MTDQEPMETLSQAMERLRVAGYGHDWNAEGGKLRCPECGHLTSAEEVGVDETVRFEGPSDPGDEAILFALACDRCGSRGLYAAPYGPEASADDVEVMTGLHRRSR